MNIGQMHTEFKIGVDKIDSLNSANLLPEEIDVLLNNAISSFVNQRAYGNNAKKQGLEETQKRVDDLRSLISNYQTSTFVTNSNNKPGGVFVNLPSDYRHAIEEEATIIAKDCNSKVVTSGNLLVNTYYLVTSGSITYKGTTYTAPTYFKTISNVEAGYNTYTGTGTVYSAILPTLRTPVIPKTHDRYNRIALDPFNKPDTEEIIRLGVANLSGTIGTFEIIGDPNTYLIKDYFLRYIAQPASVRYGTTYSTPTTDVDCNLPDPTHKEIISMAVLAALEDIQSARYQSNMIEASKVE